MDKHDMEHCIETVRHLNNPASVSPDHGPCEERLAECDYPDCDCFDSEIVMLSNGYAEVYQDGSVVQFGVEIAKVEPDAYLAGLNE